MGYPTRLECPDNERSLTPGGWWPHEAKDNMALGLKVRIDDSQIPTFL